VVLHQIDAEASNRDRARAHPLVLVGAPGHDDGKSRWHSADFSSLHDHRLHHCAGADYRAVHARGVPLVQIYGAPKPVPSPPA
jgi:hypothetical protein